MKSKEDLDLIAAAAAKLALQQLDPAAKRNRQEFSCGPPQAVISFHLKQLVHINKDFIFNTMYMDKKEVLLYLRVQVQDLVKCTKVIRFTKMVKNPRARKFTMVSLKGAEDEEKQDVLINQVKTFGLKLSRKQKDPSNVIRIELRLLDNDSSLPAKQDILLCDNELHLYDFFKELYGSKVIPLERDPQRSTFALLDFDYTFRYGALGYGHSHQISQKETSIASSIKDSLFVRVQAAAGRKDNEGFLIPSTSGKPSFIPFIQEKDEEDSGGLNIDRPGPTRESTREHSLFFKAKEINIDLVERMMRKKKRFQKMRDKYLQLNTRNDRIKYLTTLVSSDGGEKTDSGSYVYVDGPEDADDDDDFIIETISSSEHAKSVIGKLSPLLNMASSVQRRLRTEKSTTEVRNVLELPIPSFQEATLTVADVQTTENRELPEQPESITQLVPVSTTTVGKKSRQIMSWISSVGSMFLGFTGSSKKIAPLDSKDQKEEEK